MTHLKVKILLKKLKVSLTSLSQPAREEGQSELAKN